MKLFILYLLALIPSIMTPSAVLAYDAWVSPVTPGVAGEYYTLSYDYQISDLDNPSQDVRIPNCDYGCFFGLAARTGLGQTGGLCDSGGSCASGTGWESSVPLSRGATWRSAFEAFIAKYGRAGHKTKNPWLSTKDAPYIRWDALCVGFITLTSRQGISVLAPGSVCGGVPRPNLNCNVNLPSLVELGNVVLGTTDATGSIQGAVDCGGEATVMGSLLNRPQIDGHDVAVEINNIPMGRTARAIGKGRNVPLILKAVIRGTLRNAGDFSSDAVLQISYY